MNWPRSFLMAGLSLISPALPILGSIVNYITDENTSGLDVLLSFLSAGIESPVSDHFDKTLKSFASSIAFDVATDILNHRDYPSARCSFCNIETSSKIIDTNDKPICEECYIKLSGKILLPNKTQINPHYFFNNNDAIILNKDMLVDDYHKNGVLIPIIVPPGEIKTSTMINNVIVLGNNLSGKYILGEIKRQQINLGDISSGKINLGKIIKGNQNF